MTDRPVAVDAGETVQQDKLPYPVVAYPAHYGVFIGFKQDEDSPLHFCSCAEEPIRNYIRCQVEHQSHPTREPAPDNILGRKFPEEANLQIQNFGIEEIEDIVDVFRYEDQLCHMCNVVVPRYRYCHEMYGTVFIQNYGWYVNQKLYEYGVCASTSAKLITSYLFDALPEEVADIAGSDFEASVNRYRELWNKEMERNREIEEAKKEAIAEVRADLPDDIDFQERLRRIGPVRETYDEMDRLSEQEEKELEELKSKLIDVSKKISDAAENEVRIAVNHYEKGSRWTSETILYQLIESNYPEYTIKRHYRPEFLDGLELDVFIEEARLGIEYQGVQHYEPVEHWGGEEGLERRKERDAMKQQLCAENDIELVHVRYSEDLSDGLVDRKIDPFIE